MGPTRPPGAVIPGRASAVLLVVLLVASGVIVPVVTMAEPGTRSTVGTATSDATEESTIAPSAAESRGTTAHVESRNALPASTTTDGTIHQRTVLSLTPAQPGQVAATTRYELPDSVRSLEVQIPANAMIRQTSGFSEDGDRTYVWDEQTSSPRLVYDFAVNRTFQGARSPDNRETATSDLGTGSTPATATDSSGTKGPRIAADGRVQTAAGDYSFVDVGSWAITQVPSMRVSWRYSGSAVTLRKSTTVDGEGATGGEMAYLGPYEEHTRAAHNQQFRLIVPEAATLRESPERILDSLASASGRLVVGQRDSEVFFVAAPTGTDWGPLGLEYGGSDAWIRADSRLDAVTNVWLHEYVHTRQGYQSTAATRWTEEGAADYYTALVTFEQGLISFDTFRDRLRRGSTGSASDAVLADPTTWEGFANYLKGALVWGVIDFRIRTVGDRSADDVLARLNAHGEPVTASVFLNAVATVGDSDVRRTARQYTETDAAPEPWSQDDHAEAFSGPNVRALVDGGTYRISGPYREQQLTSDRTLVTGETLTASVPVTNVGDEAAVSELTIERDGTVVASESAQISPDEERTLTVEAALNETGTYTVGTDSGTVTFTVAEPASVTAQEVSIDSESVAPGETVTVTVSVVNDAERPADGTVELLADGGQHDGTVLGSDRVRLDVGTRTMLSFSVSFEEPATYLLRAGDATTTLEVREGVASTIADGALPAPVVIFALLLAMGLLRRRRG